MAKQALKWSEAMRKGIRMSDPIHGPYYVPNTGTKKGCAACALGALVLGLGLDGKEAERAPIHPRLAALRAHRIIGTLPENGLASGEYDPNLARQIVRAFEWEPRMSRSAIADALEEAGL